MAQLSIGNDKMKMFRTLRLITLISSILGVLGFGFLVFVQFDSPYHVAHCERFFSVDQAECERISKYGAHEVWLSAAIVFIGFLVTNLFDILSVIVMRKSPVEGIFFYAFSFVLYVCVLIYANPFHLDPALLFQLLPVTAMLILFLTCLKKQK